ncbi:MAG: methyltransferase domain-containing protein [Candidatus Nealsonbacteria bacterium]
MNLKYSFEKYVYLSRWMDYWYQVKEILFLHPRKILEVGIGNKVVCNYLKSEGVDVITFDVDEKLKPDVNGSVKSMPFEDSSFDVVLCAEVLEHLPFDDFEKALKELKRVSGRYVVLSLPHFGPAVKISLKIPFVKEIKLAFKVYFPIVHKFNGEHYWEIGKKGYPLSKIREILKNHFKIKKEFVPFESQYHRFYILEK